MAELDEYTSEANFDIWGRRKGRNQPRVIDANNGIMMPIEKHPSLKAPSDLNIRLWRCMDFAKFVSLISRKQLYFCNLEILAKADPHEGMLSEPNFRHRNWHSISDLTKEEVETVFFKQMNDEETRIQFESHRNSREYWVRRRAYDRRTMSINCWHANSYESAAMWAQYASAGQGVALTSTYSKIEAALDVAPQRIFMGMVQYLDWSSEVVDNTLVFPFSKRMSFNYENELRLVYWNLEVQNPINVLCQKLSNHTMDHLYRRVGGDINWNMIDDDIKNVKFDPGLYVPVEIDTLIENVFVSPTSPNWFLDAVQSVLEKFGVNGKVVRSEISSAPLR